MSAPCCENRLFQTISYKLSWLASPSQTRVASVDLISVSTKWTVFSLQGLPAG